MASDKKVAAEAFSQKLNSTPAAGDEADRFRTADDRLKSLSVAALSTIRALANPDAEKDLPPEIVAVLESWCFLHDEKPASVSTCAKLAADPDDLRLVGMSSLEFMPAEDLAEVSQRMEGLDAEERSCRRSRFGDDRVAAGGPRAAPLGRGAEGAGGG
mmetsp:Transcript_19726/g.40152  ORF Transcript_19726/g.40152 Transcript_19726/m.40152 type:complete len:158 (-) Transcript_19726:156-629(-)